MAAEVFNGSALAERIRSTIKPRVEELRQKGAAVRLDAILVGQPDAGVMFARSQQKRCERFGIEYRLHTLGEDIDDTTLQGYIRQLSTDPAVTGVMLNLPLPAHLDAPAAQYAIDPYKDVEGVNPANIGMLFYGSPIIAPCTAMAVMAILAEIGIEARGKSVAVIGQGNIVGKPIALYMMGQEATVLACNKYTQDLAAVTSQADVVVAAAGVAELVGPEHIRDGAVVIDVGINPRPPKPGEADSSGVVGDVHFEAVKEKASWITPVPGGVGPVTVALLLQGAVEAAWKQRGDRRIR